jgi:hypothetical protein
MYLTHETFLKKVAASGSKYWQEGKNYRWQYMSYVIDILKEICPDDTKLIEAGTSGMPLSDQSYLYEYPAHDLNVIPFHLKTDGGSVFIPENYFDCFVALQVWEHLDNQERAFKEVMRISKSAILSFPYMWPKGKGHDARHVGIDDIKIKQWTCGVKPEKTKLINNRMVCVWIFK